MANLKFSGMHGGSQTPYLAVLPITTSVDIDAGTILALNSENKLVVYAGTGEIIGTVASDYKCKSDPFNPENGGSKVRVNLSQSSIYTMPLPTISAFSASNDGVVTVSDTSLAGIGGKLGSSLLVLEKKGANSASTLKEGDVLEIASATDSQGKLVITLADSVTIGAGDCFRIVPSFGFDMLGVSNTNLVFANTTSIAKVVGTDASMKNAYISLKKAFLS